MSARQEMTCAVTSVAITGSSSADRGRSAHFSLAAEEQRLKVGTKQESTGRS